MADPQGLFAYEGLGQLVSGSFTLGHGLSPSMATIYTAPINRPLPLTGSMVISYGGTRITFPDCKLDQVTRDFTEEGVEVWGLHLLDHRWRWKYGRISGRYNLRDAEKRLDPDTEKRPRDLARLCFEAMGEKNVDLNALPNDQLPEIDWDYARPDQVLGEILDAAGCRVVLGPNNRVSVCKKNIGARLPSQGVISASVAADPAERPDKLVFAGKTVWQADIPLRAIGRDVNAEFKAIDDLSYKPRDGWEWCDVPHFTAVTDPKAKRLAQETVFRTYQVVAPFKIPGFPGGLEIKDIARVLPLEANQVKKARFDAKVKAQFLPPWVYGLYYAGNSAPKNNFEAMAQLEPIAGDVKKYPQGLYTLGFSVDQERGIVTFSQPVFRYVPAPNSLPGGLIKPADLRLRIAVQVRDDDSGGWIRTEVVREMPGQRLNTEPEYIVRDDVALGHFRDDGAQAVTNNRAEFDKQAKHYLDTRQAEFEINEPATVSWPELRPLQPDGAVQQITWSVSEAGFASTRASRNREEQTKAMTYTEKRWTERVNAALAAQRPGAQPPAQRPR